MIKKIITFLIGGIVCAGPGFAEDVSVNDLEAAFEKLTIKIDQSSLSGKEVKKLGFFDDGDGIDIDYSGFVYVLDFRNRSSINLNNLKVECRFFYTLDIEWRAGYAVGGRNLKHRSKSEQKYYEDSLDINLRPEERYKAETRSFVIKSWALDHQYYSDDGDKGDADPIGLWVRVSIETPAGDTVTRDFCEPDSLPSNVSWDGKSI
ncbi:hypothetical protein [Tichowtungia aerotolerans]|uniref:Uncharacterized protein n=1 Tax=Tichowtungia aerotolerans TaxID=2697043 RepID=A0A6P1M9S1_9BACT|nr:hypothetical protein [Tichowtungia aerotolerans]QHI70581.1 hypothetical protein GT409_14405 [Tichowtungia aerotolerans]